MEKEKIKFIEDVAIILRPYGFSDEVSEFVGCQFALESDFGKSSLAKEHQNYCGMRFPLVRPTLAKPIDGSSFAAFDNLVLCVVDFILCFAYHQPCRKDMEIINYYKSFIKWYCPEKTYIQRITNLFNQFQNERDK